MEEWAWSITLIGSIGAIAAAVAAWKAAKAVEKTSLAQILMQLTDAYSSPEMLSGMKRLRDWKNKHGKTFANKFADMRNNPDEYPKIKEEDEARRRYSHHFYKIWLLFDLKLANKDFVKKWQHVDR